MAPGCGTKRLRPLSLFLLASTGVAAGALLGAVTNSINGYVSPLYFRNILGWQNLDDVWRASIAQGIFEGILLGLCFSVVFIAAIGIISKAQCSYWRGCAYIGLVTVAALIAWAAGGAIAMGLATLSPEFYRHAFWGVPEDFIEMLRYAWVGGSIWGVELGGLAFSILAVILFYSHWRRDTLNAKEVSAS
jgi:hypothetical protein